MGNKMSHENEVGAMPYHGIRNKNKYTYTYITKVSYERLRHVTGYHSLMIVILILIKHIQI